MTRLSGTQVALDLQPDLLHRFGTLRECVHHSALNYPRGLKAVAADCDISVSELSRRLNPSDGDARSLDVNLLVKIIESTGDLAPLHWLMARFLQDPDARRQSAIEQLATMLPHIAQLIADARDGKPVIAGKGRSK